MRKLRAAVVMSGVVAVLAGCGPEGAPEDASATLATTEQQLTPTGELKWYQNQPPVALGPFNGRTCFLVSMEGRFRGSGEEIRVYESFGSWFVGGKSAQADVAAGARCVNGTPSGEYVWKQGQGPVHMGSASGRVCFLTGVTGKFEGFGEWVHAYVSGGQWYLGGGSAQVDVGGRARCISVSSYSGEYNYNSNNGSLNMGYALDRACALTRVSGKFMGYGEKVHVLIDPNYFWFFGGYSNQGGAAGSARCF